jgi:hypothetical protein
LVVTTSPQPAVLTGETTMYVKALSMLLVSGLVAGAAVTSADAAPVRRVPVQQTQVNPFDSWLAANGQTAINLQSGFDGYDDQGNHEFSHHDAVHDGGHGGHR